MATFPKQVANQQEIDAGVQRAAQALAPLVVRIRHTFGPDWTGEPSIFFRIVLADEYTKRPRLSDITETVERKLTNEVKADELGFHAYFNFRTQSEQAELNEPAWA